MIIDDKRQVNFQCLVVGVPGAGKSVLLRAIARRAIEEDGAIVVAHDLLGDWRAEWGIPVVKTPAKLREWILSPTTRAVSARMSADDLGRTTLSTVARLNTARDVRRPLLLVYDEGALVETSGATHQGDLDRRMTAYRRHRGLGIAWNVQRVTMLPDAFWALTTDVYLYQLSLRKSALSSLEENCALAPGALASLAHLSRHRAIHIRRGVGIVGGL